MQFADEKYQIAPKQTQDNLPEKYLCYANETRVDGGKEEEEEDGNV